MCCCVIERRRENACRDASTLSIRSLSLCHYRACASCDGAHSPRSNVHGTNYYTSPHHHSVIWCAGALLSRAILAIAGREAARAAAAIVRIPIHE